VGEPIADLGETNMAGTGCNLSQSLIGKIRGAKMGERINGAVNKKQKWCDLLNAGTLSKKVNNLMKSWWHYRRDLSWNNNSNPYYLSSSPQ
jgi:hypothetical protein